MSLLPTTRINSLVSTSNGGSGSSVEPSSIPGVQDEDILLVDFQPVVVIPNSQILSSPSTTTSTAMYPLPPPVAQLPGAHMVGLNHHPSVSSDGVTTPISATGSSGKVNPNNFSLVNLSNHAHHNNNTSREESDFNYPTHQQHHRPRLSSTNNPAILPIGGDDHIPYDEDDEYARHQALAQPSYMTNKRRSRRFNSREAHNHVWDNTNHVGFHHQQSLQPHMSSSLSSSEDSDTGFLMGTRKTQFTRRSVQKVVDPPLNPVGGGNASPSATTGLLPNLGNRKRVRRRRPSARNRKPANNQRDKIPNPSDVLSFCCCLCQDDTQRTHRGSTVSSIKGRYLRLTCFLIVIIVVAVLTSITLSLQRKVDSIDLSLNKLDQAIGSPLSSDSANGANGNVHKPVESLETLISAHNVLNSTVVNFKTQLDQVLNKLQDLTSKINEAASKPDGVAEVKGALAKLGSRVEELSATIESVQGNIEKLNKSQNSSPINNNSDGSSGSAGEPQSVKST